MKDEGKHHAFRIMNERNYDHLVSLPNQKKGKIAYGGTNDGEDKYIQPTIVANVSMHGEPPALSLQYWITYCTLSGRAPKSFMDKTRAH